MSNNIWCRKKFISSGESLIELADINIRKIQVIDDGKVIDRTDFLKYGNAYGSLQKIDSIKLNTIDNTQIRIEKDEEGIYYFDYDNSDTPIGISDKLVIQDNESNNKVYCLVTDVKDKRVFFLCYTKNNVLLNCLYTKLQIIKYIDIEEYTVTYEITIDNEDTVTEEQEYIVPIFLPDMKQPLSAKKNILIHVNNDIAKMSFILLGKNDYCINNLTLNSPHIFEHSKDTNNSNNSDGYTTFILCLLYNGDKSWFVI